MRIRGHETGTRVAPTPVVWDASGVPDSLERAMAAVDRYCQTRVPERLREEIRIECHRRGTAITIVEARPPWSPEAGPEWSTSKVAQLRLDEPAGIWALYWPDRNGRWHRYEQVSPRRTVSSLIAEIEADPTGIFWG